MQSVRIEAGDLLVCSYTTEYAEYPDDDTNAANARLIAAAPDLLKALHGLLDPATYEDGEWYRQARQAARDAIAKAEGK